MQDLAQVDARLPPAAVVLAGLGVVECVLDSETSDIDTHVNHRSPSFLLKYLG